MNNSSVLCIYEKITLLFFFRTNLFPWWVERILLAQFIQSLCRSTLQVQTKRTHFRVKSIDRVRAHIDILMKKKKKIEQWEPTCLERSVSYSNAMNTCSKEKIYIYIYIYEMGDEFYSLKILFDLYRSVLFCSIGSTYSLVLKMRKILWWTYSFIKQTWKAAHRNCNCCRIHTSRLLILKKKIVYVYNKILSWKRKRIYLDNHLVIRRKSICWPIR
jgi:hypothetical protein